MDNEKARDGLLQKGLRPKTLKEYRLTNTDRYIASAFYLIIMPGLMFTATYHMEELMWVENTLRVAGLTLGLTMSVGIYTKWFEKGVKQKLKNERKVTNGNQRGNV